ncbi:hypothetical protein C8Q72DRAFT_783702 [Fomitopsis betulina]|nr:hypothetical protein C8Q72DRAFT_783702 [Fomitopsis betulina]
MALSSSPLNTVALFGATGMLGSLFLPALLENIVEGYKPTVRVFIRPGKKLSAKYAQNPRVQVADCDYLKGGDELVENLRGVDAIVSVISGPADVIYYELLEAAVKAGHVKRFYLSSYGFTQLCTAPGQCSASLHLLWNYIEMFRQHIKLHPAVLEGQITYTFIGSGDLLDMVRPHYTLQVVHAGNIGSRPSRSGAPRRRTATPTKCPSRGRRVRDTKGLQEASCAQKTTEL